MRIEGHYRRGTIIPFQDLCDRAFERTNIRTERSVPILDFDQERNAARDQAQDFREIRDGLAASPERNGSEFLNGLLAHETFTACQPLQCIVMEDSRLPVRRELNVDLDPVSMFQCGIDRRTRVFRPSIRSVMQRAMGDWAGQELPWQQDFHDTSKMPSISTATFKGSAPALTAERECRPASPKTATKRSEAPLITFG